MSDLENGIGLENKDIGAFPLSELIHPGGKRIIQSSQEKRVKGTIVRKAIQGIKFKRCLNFINNFTIFRNCTKAVSYYHLIYHLQSGNRSNPIAVSIQRRRNYGKF